MLILNFEPGLTFKPRFLSNQFLSNINLVDLFYLYNFRVGCFSSFNLNFGVFASQTSFDDSVPVSSTSTCKGCGLERSWK